MRTLANHRIEPVPPGATGGYSGFMSIPSEISQRDLRMRSREIMDAVEQGERFTVTRDGRQIAELVPLRPRRSVPAEDFLAASAAAPSFDETRFRAELDTALDAEVDDRHAR